MSALIAWMLRVGLRGAVTRALELVERRAQLEGDLARLRSETTVALAREAVREAQIMADLNKQKFQFPVFWVFAGLFVVPLAAWWAAVILDSIFNFSWSVADLPTPQMREWAGDMIRWIFYVGSVAGAVRAIR